MRGAAVHEPVGDDGGRVAHADPHRLLGLVEDLQVGVVVPHEELQVEVDGLVARQDLGELLDLGLGLEWVSCVVFVCIVHGDVAIPADVLNIPCSC